MNIQLEESLVESLIRIADALEKQNKLIEEQIELDKVFLELQIHLALCDNYSLPETMK